MIAYKLFRLRKDGSIGPLFINRKLVVPIGTWLLAEDHPTKGFAHRPGWHSGHSPSAPHLSNKGRIWCKVEIINYELLQRPASQGGLWYLSKWIKVLEKLDQQSLDSSRGVNKASTLTKT
jgi:hypothetical protein